MDLSTLRRHAREAGINDPAWTELCEALVELAQGELPAEWCWSLPPRFCDEFEGRLRHLTSPALSLCRSLVQEVRAVLVESARQRLTCLSAVPTPATDSPALRKVVTCLRARDGELQRTAFALELLELIEPAALRTAELRESVADDPSAAEADRLLDEATRCYAYGLYTACATLCCSVVEQAIRSHAPATSRRSPRRPCLSVLANHLQDSEDSTAQMLSESSLTDLVSSMEKARIRAAHQGLLTEDEARDCLLSARQAVQLLVCLPQTVG